MSGGFERDPLARPFMTKGVITAVITTLVVNELLRLVIHRKSQWRVIRAVESATILNNISFISL